MKLILTIAMQALLGASMTGSAFAVGECGSNLTTDINAKGAMVTDLKIDGFKPTFTYVASSESKIMMEDFTASFMTENVDGVMTVTAGETCSSSMGMGSSGSLSLLGLSTFSLGYPLLSAGAFLAKEFVFAAAESDESHDNCDLPTVKVTIYTSDIMKAPKGDNPCDGTKPADGGGFDNSACFADDGTVPVGPQAGANVSDGYTGLMEYNGTEPISKPYYETDLCPVNVHWHLGAEHLSDGQFDADGHGPSDIEHRRLASGKERKGNLCHHYKEDDSKFTEHYEWKHCLGMEVGQTYEVHWPHSKAGACGTPNQYQSPFYDGVFCHGSKLTLSNLPQEVGVQAQVFTIVNDESYFYPDLIRGMIVDGEMGADMAIYVGSTTGTSRNNESCSMYNPITWQVDRTCHMISASSFDRMCGEMKAQRDDMSSDLHAHGSRITVDDKLAADNLSITSHTP